jgi:hypothetical protein
MCPARALVTRDDLAGLARAITRRRLEGVSRLRGGTKKGVYRLVFDDGGTAVAYLWAEAENYWPATADNADNAADPFSPASGASLFEAASRELDAAGVRTPQVYLSLYTLAMRLSFIAGPLRLLDGDFPDRDPMMNIVEHNIRQALTLLT